MPSKHVDEQTWRKVEKETVRAVIAAQASIKETEVLRILILKGLKHVNEDDYREFAEKKRG
ncbi:MULTISPECIES: hypothetical protein [unclassified Shewanella]|uniref:hypothetical protein n=1 Tax=unclassified Shewanella TaxID=196818 RepID=UPI0021DA1578|nr:MULTISPECIES: hypothetical protein [unclassified Shewanella]MCU8036853.1 hypothetical protein [Shewanella sp. SM71]MCU8096997.1 hypothetical protein [Shewanella sp. SM102]